jgi:4-amino-4-deoxy-L-arabinose transferase-like glycosyltransferase
MSVKKVLVLLVIVAVAAVLRLYQLGSIPPSLDWDEASLGWNAYSILKTGSDEYGKPVPVSLRSFNDFKPALYAYAAIPSIVVFGLNEFSVRLPSAMAGILTVLVAFLLVRKLTNDELLGYWVTGLLAISPWHIQFSRGAFEANLALFFFVLGIYFLLKFLDKERGFFFLLSTFSFMLSIYSYHSSRVVIPIFLMGITIVYRKIFLRNWRGLILNSLFIILLIYPLVRNTFHTGALSARYQTVAAKLEPVTIVKNYLSHFDLNFLFVTSDGQDRHHAPGVGLLYLAELPFLLAGFYFLVKNRPAWLPFLLVWFLSGPTAAALANDTPHAIRSLLFLPTWQIVIAYGILKSFKLPKYLKLLMVMLFLANIFYFLHQYFVHLPKETARAWQYGYKQVVQKVLALENNYGRVYVTSTYDQPYIYFLFYGRVAPTIKNSGYFYANFDKYQFSYGDINYRGLYILSSKDNLPDGYNLKIIDTVNFPDGTEAFRIGTIRRS